MGVVVKNRISEACRRDVLKSRRSKERQGYIQRPECTEYVEMERRVVFESISCWRERGVRREDSKKSRR